LSLERVLRQEVIATLGRAEFKSYSKLRPWRTIWTFFHIWLGLVSALALGLWVWRYPLGYPSLLIPIIVFYIGTRQNAIAVQIHEAAHNLLFKSRRLNDVFCNIFGAYWVLNDIQSYRRMHLVHHTDLHLETDPDRELYELSPNTDRFKLAKLLLQDLLWITALRRIFAYLRPNSGGSFPNGLASRIQTFTKLAAQGLLLGSACFLLGWPNGALFYLVFWLVPLFSIFPAIIRLRIVTEHYSPALHSNKTSGLPFVSRTTCTHPLEIYLFGCDMEYHFEHHLLPSIPHPQLARLHRTLIEKCFFEELPNETDYLSGGYLRFWGRLLRGKLPAEAPFPQSE